MKCLRCCRLCVLKLGMHCILIQVKYNVLERDPEKAGLLDKCQELGVTLVAHSPLQQGMLTGTDTLLLYNSPSMPWSQQDSQKCRSAQPVCG